MPPPTPPLALNAANLALLQPRPNAPARPASAAASSASETPAAAPPPPFTGRGRLIDIIA